MKRKLFVVPIVAAAAVLAGQTVFAQQEQQPGQSSRQGSQLGKSQTSSQSSKLLRVTELIGSPVKSKDGQSLGEIEDITVNSQNGQIQFAILGKGGFLGLGEKMVPVPWQAVNVRPGQGAANEYMVNLDRQKLQSAPTIDKNDQTKLNSPDFVVVTYRFYEIVPPSGVGATGSQSESELGTQQQQQQQQRQQQRTPQQP